MLHGNIAMSPTGTAHLKIYLLSGSVPSGHEDFTGFECPTATEKNPDLQTKWFSSIAGYLCLVSLHVPTATSPFLSAQGRCTHRFQDFGEGFERDLQRQDELSLTFCTNAPPGAVLQKSKPPMACTCSSNSEG